MWRPKEGWETNPCEKCSNKEEDEYGLLCDLACGTATAYANREVGADAMLVTLESLIRQIAPSSKLVDLIYGNKEEK